MGSFDLRFKGCFFKENYVKVDRYFILSEDFIFIYVYVVLNEGVYFWVKKYYLKYKI